MSFKKIIKQGVLNVFPEIYRSIVFRKLKRFNWESIHHYHYDPELLLLPQLLKDPSAVFFDVGANKGEFTFMACKCIKSKQVYSFEPNQQLFLYLSKIFTEVNLRAFALSDKEGRANFKIPEINAQSDDTLGTLETTHVEQAETGRNTYEVKTITLDGFVELENIQRLDLLKIDVEGHEGSVLKGAEKTLEKFHPAIIIEAEQRHHPGTDLQELLKPLRDKGYVVSYFDYTSLQMKEFKEHQAGIQDMAFFGTRQYINNFVCVYGRAETERLFKSIAQLIQKKT